MDYLPVRHLALLLVASLSPTLCLSKGRLLVPYQTFMNYERPVSSGQDRNVSLSASAVLEQRGEESCCIPGRTGLFCRTAGTAQAVLTPTCPKPAFDTAPNHQTSARTHHHDSPSQTQTGSDPLVWFCLCTEAALLFTAFLSKLELFM